MNTFGASAMDVACPQCGVGIGEECTPGQGINVRGQPHRAREEVSPEYLQYRLRSVGVVAQAEADEAKAKSFWTVGDFACTDLGEKAKIIEVNFADIMPIKYEIELRADGTPGVGTRFSSDGTNMRRWKDEPAVDHIRPKHYKPDDPYEPLKVMLAQHGKEAVVAFCHLTAEKYLARAGKKDGEPMHRDFRKAAFYLVHAADLLEKP